MNKLKEIITSLKNLIKNNGKDIAVRAVKTFVQAFLGSICIESFITITDWQTAKALMWSTAIAGASAGIAAIWNLGISYFDYTVLNTETEEE